MQLYHFDEKIIAFARRVALPMARFGIFLVFFWFGALKVAGLSPASPLVEQLFERTIPFMSFGTFIVLFGLLECGIGILFLIPRLDRVAIAFLVFHMTTTLLPLVLLPSETWSGFLVPTLEGQYIIKNILIIAAAIAIAARLTPLTEGERRSA